MIYDKAYTDTDVSRRTGGLEKLAKHRHRGYDVSRRTGGLEMKPYKRKSPV